MSEEFNRRITRGKSLARLLAVQALYGCSVTDGNNAGWDMNHITENLMEFAGEYVENDSDITKKIDKRFLENAVKYVLENIDKIDKEISFYLDKSWSIERIGKLLASILRVAVYEIKNHPKTPDTVIISEYIDLTGEFFGPEEVGFVNAVLDRMSKTLRE